MSAIILNLNEGGFCPLSTHWGKEAGGWGKGLSYKNIFDSETKYHVETFCSLSTATQYHTEHPWWYKTVFFITEAEILATVSLGHVSWAHKAVVNVEHISGFISSKMFFQSYSGCC